MNEHEAERIAAALNIARPDWPKSSLLTLMRKHLMQRPRRDVFVAFAWVASEPNTATPARVLEAGPWWRAASVEGTNQPRDVIPPHLRCTVCSQHRDVCNARRTTDPDPHEFTPPADRKRAPEAMAAIVEDMRGRKEPIKPRPEPVARPATTDPRVAAARDALTTQTDAEETNDG